MDDACQAFADIHVVGDQDRFFSVRILQYASAPRRRTGLIGRTPRDWNRSPERMAPSKFEKRSTEFSVISGDDDAQVSAMFKFADSQSIGERNDNEF